MDRQVQQTTIRRSLTFCVLLTLAFILFTGINSSSKSLSVHCFLLPQKSAKSFTLRSGSFINHHQQQPQPQQSQLAHPLTTPTSNDSNTSNADGQLTSQNSTTTTSNKLSNYPIIKNTNNNNKFSNCSARRQFLLTSKEAQPTEHIPDCAPDGSYQAMQCMPKMAICWCADFNGKFIPNTQSERPNCEKVQRQPVEQSAEQVIAAKQRLFHSRNNNNSHRKSTPVQNDNGQLGPIELTNQQQFHGSFNDKTIDSLEIDLGMFQLGSHLRESAVAPDSYSFSSSISPATSSSSSLLPLSTSTSTAASSSTQTTGSDQSDQTLVLIPGDCATSRSRQLAKSKEFPESRPWIPECHYSGLGDDTDGKNYSGLQCHVANTSICFCVDTYTGLPLGGIITRASYLGDSGAGDNLDDASISNNNNNRDYKPDCAAANKQSKMNLKDVGPPMSISGQMDQLNAPLSDGSSTSKGINTVCGGDKGKKLDFLSAMFNSFQEELYNRMRLNDSLSKEIGFSQSHYLTRVQIMKWKFQSMDKNSDNQLDDDEWSLFRSLLKLARDREQQTNYKNKIMQEQQRDYRLALKLLEDRQQQQSQSTTISSSGSNNVVMLQYMKPAPIVLLIPQRQCWQEFLESCQNKSQTRQTITMKKWLDCTETSPIRIRSEEANAAQQRRGHKNPFLSILKQD